MPTVSVLMSAFNAERFLEQAVRSVLDQSWTDLELIVVDDASTDRTAEILARLQEPRLKLIRQPRNAGLVQAMNTALEQAQGEFIARMDADDVAMPERLAQQIALLRARAELAAVGSSCVVIDELDKVVDRIDVETEPAAIARKLMQWNQMVHPSVTMRTAALRELGGYRDLAGRTAQDYDLWLRMAERWQLANLAAPLLRYRVHGAQLSVANLRVQSEAASLYRALAEQRRSGGTEDLPAAWRRVRQQGGSIRNQCVQQLLHQADQLSRAGNEQAARAMHRRAAFTGPLTPAFRGRLWRWMKARVPGLAPRLP